MTNKHLGSIYLATAATIWGGMYVVSKVVLTVIQPIELVWLRYVVALITLITVGMVTRQSWRIRRQDFPHILAIGVIGYDISIWTQFVGTKLSSAQMGAMITSATPALMVIFARLLLKEKITFRKGLSTCIAMIGVLCIVGVGDIGDANQLGGMVLGIAALSWALMSVLIKRIPSSYSQLVVTTYAILIATVLITPFAFFQIDQAQIYALSQPAIWSGVLYLGIVATAAAFFLWNKGLQMVDAGSGGLYFFFQPIAGTLLAWLFLGERVGITFWIG
ncbi:EamA family transporter, partial [Desulfosporosinus sp. OT]|uniref:DMT family transporter n=1 Tax=Desulfosporosinus sp. OT TaxID=913865 RepID=UPI000223AC83